MTVKTEEGNTYTIVVKGDIKEDGNLTAVDLSLLQGHAVNNSQLDGIRYEAADINGDGSITAVDLSKLKMLIVGLVEEATAVTEEQIKTVKEGVDVAIFLSSILVKKDFTEQLEKMLNKGFSADSTIKFDGNVATFKVTSKNYTYDPKGDIKVTVTINEAKDNATCKVEKA